MATYLQHQEDQKMLSCEKFTDVFLPLKVSDIKAVYQELTRKDGEIYIMFNYAENENATINDLKILFI